MPVRPQTCTLGFVTVFIDNLRLLFAVNSWLRHPRIRENWKTVTAAFLLFVAGIGMCEFQLSLCHHDM